MEISIDEKYNHVFKKVYTPVILETAEGNQLSVCMRDDTFEISITSEDMDDGVKFFRVNMQDMTITERKWNGS